MQNFHEDKLWQESYVALMDVHEAVNEGNAPEVIRTATHLAAKIADGLSRMDRQTSKEILLDAIGHVAVVRTHLAVAWGQGMMPDDTFRALDTKYANLSAALQQRK